MAQKSLGRNALYNVIYKCLNVVFPLITMAYVSRILLPVGVGKVASALNIVAYFTMIASLGLPTYGVKVMAGNRDERKSASKAFSELFAINAISTIICSFVYVMMILSVDFFQSKVVISMVVGIQLFANVINIDWLYQGYEEYRYITIRSTVVKMLSLIAVFVFVKEQSDYIIYALITVLSLVSNFILNIVKARQFISLDFKNIDVTHHLKPIFALLGSTLAIEIYLLGGTTILSVLKDYVDVAYFSYSSKAIDVARTLIVAICAVFLPRLNYYISHKQFDEFNNLATKGISFILNISIPVAIVLFVLSDDCVKILFGTEYLSVIPSMRIMCISLVTIALSNFTGYQILVSIGKENFVLYSTIIGALINLLVNFFLIIPLGFIGASIAAVLTEAIIAAYQFYYVLKFVPIKIEIKEIKKIIVPTAFMILSILAIRQLSLNIYIEIILCSALGMLTYFYFALKMKNDLFIMAIKKIQIPFLLK